MSNTDEPQVPEGAAVLPLIPAELGVHPLLLAVLHALVFLEGSSEEVIDPDAAAEALEYLVSYLQRLEGPALQKVREDLECLADYGRSQGWPKQQVRFFKTFLQEFGVAEEGDK